jgi:hypothetical protein
MDRLKREAPLPEAMQGRWVEADDPSSELVVEGGEIAPDHKTIANFRKD